MNVFDLLVVAFAVTAAVGGWRLGFLTRATSWLGMVVGFVLAARFVPRAIELVEGSRPTTKMFLAVGFLLGGALVGQAIGLVVGSKMHLAIPLGPARLADRVGGALAGAVGVAVAVWLLVPTLADVPGATARLARGSVVARTIDRWAPTPPDTLQTLNRLVGETPFPQVFNALRESPRPGPPPAESGIDQATADAVVASTVRIEGEACSRLQEGSGFVVEPGLVVTNAHVVAGEDRTEVVRVGGERLPATVVAFDADRDLALLAVPDLDAPPLPLSGTDVGATGAVFGFPGGGPLEISPYRVSEQVRAVGRDLYDSHNTEREVLVLAADLAPGDSGAPLADPAGSVVGVAFAIAPDRPGTAYALAVEELDAVLDARRGPVDTGGCLR